MAIAGLLTAGISTAATAKQPTGKEPAKSKPAPKPKPKPVPLSVTGCKFTFVTQPPADGTTIIPAPDTGSQFGKFQCAKPIGKGAVSDTFTTDDAGDVTATYKLWTSRGTLTGKLTLTATGGGQPSTGGFGAQTFDGGFTVTGGTLLKVLGVKAPTKPVSLSSCTTSDSVHYACSQ